MNALLIFSLGILAGLLYAMTVILLKEYRLPENQEKRRRKRILRMIENRYAPEMAKK